MPNSNRPLPLLDLPYPPGMVIALLLLLVFFCMLLGQGAILLTAWAAGYDLQTFLSSFDAMTGGGERNFFRLITLINHLFTFFVPALAIAVLLYRRDWLRSFQLDVRPEGRLLGLGALWIVLAFPLALLTYSLNKALPLPDWMVQLEDSTNSLIEGFLQMDSPWELIATLFVMALVPAIGEEMVFRGILQQNLERRLRSGVAAVWLGAVIFSAFHLQFQGFLPRVLLGATLGYLYYWTRNLWISIGAHFANNALQVLAAYFWGAEMAQLETEEQDTMPWGLVVGCTILFGGLAWHLYQITRSSSPEAIETQSFEE